MNSFDPKCLPSLAEYQLFDTLVSLYRNQGMELADLAFETNIPIMKLIMIFDRFHIELRPGDREKYSYLKRVK